ncbi:MAG: hypothetical protein KJ052_18795, partial [Candidatus Hydrogenedentes bacterium]|nr:hypothetical protein [Candidatus Hydrogenedentota bacterium]
MSLKISAALGIFSGSPDRFCPSGYRDPLRPQERIAALSKVKSIKAIEVSQTDITNDFPAKEL